MAFVRTAAALAVLAAAGSAFSHDEDWRKLADRLPPVQGPIYRSGLLTPQGAAASSAFPASGITLLSQVPINQFGDQSQAANDCWGYTSPSGREYAILGLERGFGFVEITDPTNPVVVSTIPGPASVWHDVKVVGSYAYGVGEGGGGVQVIDLSRIDEGEVRLIRNQSSGGHATTHNIVSNEAAGTLYLVGANIGNGGLIRLDLSDPEAPAIAGGWTEMYVHDAQVVTWDAGPLAGREIAFCASGFDGGQTQTGLRIVDMTDPVRPVVLSTLFYPNAGYSHQVWMSEDQRYLYLNDELDETTGLVSQTTTRVIDIADPTAPALVGTFSTGLPAIDHNLYVHDGLIYQANYRSGLRVFETSDPVRPTEVAFFDTFPSSDSANFNGAWSVYPFFESGTVIVSDIERGLFVLRVEPLAAALRFSFVEPPASLVNAAGGDVIEVRISAQATSLDAASVEMLVADSGGVRRVSGVASGDGTFAFTLPPLSCGGPTTVSFAASDVAGRSFSFPESPGQGFPITPVTSVETVLADDFETDLGWSVSGTAGDGQWTRGVPVNAGRGDPPSDADGSGSAFVTDNNAANGGNSDVDGGATRLISPVFDSTGGAVVSYEYWFDTFGTPIGSDALAVEYSTNGGLVWFPGEVHDTPSQAWRGGGFVIPSNASGPQTRVRFTASDLDPPSIVEAGVDAFFVDRITCDESAFTGCNAADVAAPFGLLDPADIEAFVSAASAAGNADIFDVIAFVAAWERGCDGP